MQGSWSYKLTVDNLNRLNLTAGYDGVAAEVFFFSRYSEHRTLLFCVPTFLVKIVSVGVFVTRYCGVRTNYDGIGSGSGLADAENLKFRDPRLQLAQNSVESMPKSAFSFIGLHATLISAFRCYCWLLSNCSS
jgi:hypothetical protein